MLIRIVFTGAVRLDMALMRDVVDGDANRGEEVLAVTYLSSVP